MFMNIPFLFLCLDRARSRAPHRRHRFVRTATSIDQQTRHNRAATTKPGNTMNEYILAEPQPCQNFRPLFAPGQIEILVRGLKVWDGQMQPCDGLIPKPGWQSRCAAGLQIIDGQYREDEVRPPVSDKLDIPGGAGQRSKAEQSRERLRLHCSDRKTNPPSP
jgi:hypothetical protein